MTGRHHLYGSQLFWEWPVHIGGQSGASEGSPSNVGRAFTLIKLHQRHKHKTRIFLFFKFILADFI